MKILITTLVIASCLRAQTAAIPETILAQPVANAITNEIVLGAITSAKAPGTLEAQGIIGSPYGISNNTVMLTWPPPSEAMSVYQVGAAGLTNRIFARRGMYSTYPKAQTQGTLIWLGPARYFANSNPSGRCKPQALTVLPVITIPSATVWNCPVVGIIWKEALFSWNQPAPGEATVAATTWLEVSTTGLSTWASGITWDEEQGWWQANPAQWRNN